MGPPSGMSEGGEARLARPHRGRATAREGDVPGRRETIQFVPAEDRAARTGRTDPRITGSGMQPGPCVAGRPASHNVHPGSRTPECGELRPPTMWP